MRGSVVTLAAVMALLVVGSARGEGILQSESAQQAFRCEVCRIFCIEYENAINDKAGDAPFDIAVAHARGNTSNYRWDDDHEVLRPPGQNVGTRIIDRIYSEIAKDILTPYNEQVILHALHAAAHVQNPPKMSWHFCRRVLCDHHLGRCTPDPDKRPYGEMTKAYDHFVSHFDKHSRAPQLEKHQRHMHGPSDVHRSHVRDKYRDPVTGQFDPAAMDPEEERRAMHEVEEARRRSEYYRDHRPVHAETELDAYADEL